jgi:predicted RNase H-like HicB family nuclease
MNYKAIIKQDADWWIGWVEDVPGVNAQERTREELLISLREALTDILESYREATRLAVAGEFEEVLIPARSGGI